MIHLDTWIGFCLTWVLLDKKAPAQWINVNGHLAQREDCGTGAQLNLSENASIKRLWKQIRLKRGLKCRCFLWICKSSSRGQCHGNELEQLTVHKRRPSAQLLNTHTHAMPLWTPGLLWGVSLQKWLAMILKLTLSKVLIWNSYITIKSYHGSLPSFLSLVLTLETPSALINRTSPYQWLHTVLCLNLFPYACSAWCIENINIHVSIHA